MSEAVDKSERARLIAAIKALLRVCDYGAEDSVAFGDAVDLLRELGEDPFA